MSVGELIASLGDTHIYLDQIEGVKEQLLRDPHKFDLPKLEINGTIQNINDFNYDNIKINNYESFDSIKFPLSVGL